MELELETLDRRLGELAHGILHTHRGSSLEIPEAMLSAARSVLWRIAVMEPELLAAQLDAVEVAVARDRLGLDE